MLYRDKNGVLQAGAGRGVGLHFAEEYFRRAQAILRVASGYFSLNGFELCRHLIGTSIDLRILVNQEESKNVADTIYNEVFHQERLLEELGTTTTPLHDAVKDILDRMDAGHFIIKEARTTRHSHRFHCKFYISDDKYMWSGSANFSKSGLHQSGNVEQVQACSEVGQIKAFNEFYDDALAHAYDLLEATRRCLEDWLTLVAPFQAYIRVLQLLYGQDTPRLKKGGMQPSAFQEGVIVRAVEQVRAHDGALLLVATGLGKTVIGAEVARRVTSGFVDKQVIVLAPASVHDKWRTQLVSRGIEAVLFDIGLIFQKGNAKSDSQINDLLNRLQECDERTVIIVDEAHIYRKLLQRENTIQKKNERLQEGEEKMVHLLRERMAAVVARRAKIVLLTATPYGTDRQNLNSLLYLLPLPAPHTVRDFPKWKKGNDGEIHWQIDSLPDLAELPVVTVLGLPHVLKGACQDNQIGPLDRVFVTMPQAPTQRYFPKNIHVTPVKYQIAFEAQISDAFTQRVFEAQPVPVDVYEESTGHTKSVVADVLRNTAINAWLSSPQAMLDFVRRCLNTPDGEEVPINEDQAASQTPSVSRLPEPATAKAFYAKFDASFALRKEVLTPIETSLAKSKPEDDAKFMALAQLLQKHTLEQGHKAIIFIKRRPTVYAVKEGLQACLPSLRVGATVHKSGDDFALYSTRTRKQMIKRFSPNSNGSNTPVERELNVLCCTDADGLGVDMQDACVVINYDVPSGADEIMQRAGRIIRMTGDSDRNIYLYNFVPDLKDTDIAVAQDVKHIFDKLKQRHDNAREIVGGNSVWYDEPTIIPLATKEDVQRLSSLFPSPEEQLQSEPSSIFSHVATLVRYKDIVEPYKGNFLSAKVVESDKHALFLLLRYSDDAQVYPVVYNISDNRIENTQPSDSLDLLRCDGSETAPFAIVNISDIERHSLEATKAWCIEHDKEVKLCSRVCSIYLHGNKVDKKERPALVA